MLLWDAARWIGLGVALGWVVTLGLAAAARGRLVEAGDVGVPTALAAGALLAAVALVAAYGPVRRATRLNPVIALREP
jgi:ABC-type antimicrobial peptide transport system permease subunit